MPVSDYNLVSLEPSSLAKAFGDETSSKRKKRAAEANFSKWLQQPDNLNLLGRALELELELLEPESHTPTHLRVDLLARTSDNKKKVVIELQLGDTDPGHVGQLLTYAFAKEADIAVLVAEGIIPEYKKVFEALQCTPVQFFVVLAKVFKLEKDQQYAVAFERVVTLEPLQSKNWPQTLLEHSILELVKNKLIYDEIIDPASAFYQRKGRTLVIPCPACHAQLKTLFANKRMRVEIYCNGNRALAKRLVDERMPCLKKLSGQAMKKNKDAKRLFHKVYEKSLGKAPPWELADWAYDTLVRIIQCLERPEAVTP